MSNYTFDVSGFMHFVSDVAQEDPDRIIDHSTYTNCAVGDFVEHMGFDRDEARQFSDEHIKEHDKGLDDLVGDMTDEDGGTYQLFFEQLQPFM